MKNRTGELYRVVKVDSTIGWHVKEGDVVQLVYDDGSDRPKFLANGVELWIYMSQLAPLHEEAQPLISMSQLAPLPEGYDAHLFDPVPWFCGALLVAYFIVEYIGGGIGI